MSKSTGVIIGVIAIVVLSGGGLGLWKCLDHGDGDGDSTQTTIESTDEEIVSQEPPVENQTIPVDVIKINKITIERRDGKDFIRFNENDPVPVNSKEELTQIFETSLPEMDDSVEVFGNGLEEYYRVIVILLENCNKRVVYSK